MSTLNLFDQMLLGIEVPYFPAPIPASGNVSKLWLPLIKGTDNASRRATGADAALFLCAKGYCDISFGDTVYKAGTPTQDLPTREEAYNANPMYNLVKPITRFEFLKLTSGKEIVQTKSSMSA